MFLFSPKFDWIFSHLPRFNWSCCTSPKCAYFTQIFLILLKTFLKLFSWPKFDESCWNYHMIPVNARAVSILPGTGLSVWAVSIWAVSVWPIWSGRFGLAVSVTGHFGQTMKSCRNLTLMPRRAVWLKAHSLHHHTVGCQRSRHSTQSALPSRFAIAASAVGKVVYSA